MENSKEESCAMDIVPAFDSSSSLKTEVLPRTQFEKGAFFGNDARTNHECECLNTLRRSCSRCVNQRYTRCAAVR